MIRRSRETSQNASRPCLDSPGGGFSTVFAPRWPWRRCCRCQSFKGCNLPLHIIFMADDHWIALSSLRRMHGLVRQNQRARNFTVVRWELNPWNHFRRIQHLEILVEIEDVEREEPWDRRQSTQGRQP